MRILILFFSILLLTPTYLAQVSQPTEPQELDQDVVKISTNLIQIDVSVKNSKGKSIEDLRQSDFQIFQNGKKQEISNFSFISVKENQSKVLKEEELKDIEGFPLSEIKKSPRDIRRTIAIVVDDLTMSKESIHFAKKALNRFLDNQMVDGDLVAIVLSSSKTGALQKFTADKRLLRAAIDRVRWNLSGSGNVDPFSKIEATPLEIARSNGASISQDVINEEKRQLREMREHKENIFAIRTLKNASSILTEMKELPGRKSMFLLSDGFRLNSKSLFGFQDTSIVLNPVQKLIDFANRTSVVIYTFDPRGLQPATLTARDNTVNIKTIKRGALRGSNSLGELPVSNEIENRLRERKDQLYDKQQGLQYLAEGTGGFATINNNNLNKGIQEALTDQSYYLIAYEPDEDIFDQGKQKFNELEVKVNRKNVKVRYRSGFFGTSDEQSESTNVVKESDFLNTITSPFTSDDIELKLNVLFDGNSKDDLFLNSYIHINPNDLQFTEKQDGKKEVVFEVLAVSFSADGALGNRHNKTYTVTLDSDSYRKVRKEGLVYSFVLPVKKAGEYQLKIALRDRSTNKIGSASQFIKIPALKKNKLATSGIVLENLTYEQWKKLQNTESQKSISTNPVLDTSLRRFVKGTVLKYGFEVYNSKKSSKLKMRTRLFYNGNVVYEGKDFPIKTSNEPKIVDATGALNLASNLKSGDYVLQVIVTEMLGKEKVGESSQFTRFELVE